MSRLKIVLSIIVLVLLVATAVYWSQRNKPIPVAVTEVVRGEVERTVTNTRAGTLHACRRAQLSPSLGGQIASLPVREGDVVKQGQVLFEIWNRDLRAQVELSEAEILASESLRQQACIQADFAQREAQRLSQLLDRGLASDEAAEKAISQARAGQAACEAAGTAIPPGLAVAADIAPHHAAVAVREVQLPAPAADSLQVVAVVIEEEGLVRRARAGLAHQQHRAFNGGHPRQALLKT